MNDDELLELFSAFDDVSASDTLQSSTLDFIMGAAAAVPDSAEAPEATKMPEAESAPSHAAKVTATRGAKPRLRSRWRAMRTAAVAACLALALTGGAAYAYPASTVLVTQGDTTIELHVNVFGQVLSASANDDEIQSLIDQMGLVNTQYSDSVNRVSSSLKESNPQVPVEVVMNGQSVETPEEALQPHDEAAPEPDRPAPAADERASLKTEPAPAESESATEDAPSSAAPATYLPEPGGITVGDSDAGKQDGGKHSTDHGWQSDEPSPSTGDDSTGSDTGQVIVIDEPTQPVVVDEEPGSSQDAQPVVEPPSNPKSDVQDDEEVVYDTTRPPKYHSEARTATESA